MELYTLGHSAHPQEHFLALLRQYGIQTLIDIRSKPTSRFHPHFRKKAMEEWLAQANVRYVFLGESLGGMPTDESVYTPEVEGMKLANGKPRPDFELVMSRDWFQQGIAEMLQIARQAPAAILCGEEDPTQCHRALLVGEFLRRRYPDVTVLHIRGDGRLQDRDFVSVE